MVGIFYTLYAPQVTQNMLNYYSLQQKRKVYYSSFWTQKKRKISRLLCSSQSGQHQMVFLKLFNYSSKVVVT